MDHSDQVPAADWSTIAASGALSIFFTAAYLLYNFLPHQPLFYVFLGLSLSVIVAEYWEKLVYRVVDLATVNALRKSLDSVTATISHFVDDLLRLRHEQKLVFFASLNCFFVVTFILGRQMDDAALIYAACMLLSASPLLRKLLGHSSQKLAGQASQLFQPPVTETAELADYMPSLNEISRDFSFRLRKNTNDSNATDRELDMSVFGEDALVSLEASAMSLMNESQLMMSSQLSSRTTDDDTSPIPSDVEVIDADDLPDDFPSVSSIKSGRLQSETGNYTATGTLRRNRHSTKERESSVE